MKRYKQHKDAPNYSYTYEFNLAGATVGDRQEIVFLLQKGEELTLVREPENKHDPNAVAVWARGYQVGYIPAFKAEMVANFMDHDKAAHAHVLDVHLYETDSGDSAYGVKLFLGLGSPATM